MGNSREKVISKNILPIFTGGFISIFIHLGLPRLIVNLFSIEKKPSILVIFLIAFFIPAMIGGFAATFLFTRARFIHSIIASMIFIFVVVIPEINEAFLRLDYSKQTDFFFLKVLIIVVSAAMLGGYLGILIKKNKPISKMNSSPPDTPS